MLAEGVVLWIFGLFAVGILGFFVMCVAVVFKVMAWVLRGLMGDSDEIGAAPPPVSRRERVCGAPRCGRANPPHARYCGRCGRPL